MDIPNNALANWVNNNRDQLRAFLGKWIAYTEQGIIANGSTLDEVCAIADKKTKNYIVYFVNQDVFNVRFR